MPTTKETLSKAIRTALHRQGRAPLVDFLKPSGPRALTRASLAATLLHAPVAGAITLGTLEHDSAIGEPFRATATATIGAGEALQPGCITTSPYKLGTLRLRDPIEIGTPRATQPGQYTIELVTSKPLTEPMYELQLRVACPGIAALTRSYIVMVDAPRGYGNIQADTGLVAQVQASAATPVPQPAAEQPQQTAVPTLTKPSVTQAAVGNTPGAGRALARRPGGKSVNPGQTYRVVRGDTLFGIAARLNERPANATWAAARMLYEANPNAFVNGDKSKLKLGAVLTIPGSAIVASLTPEAEFKTPTGPGRPTPERALPARPALVRSEDAARVETEQSSAAADADDEAEPVQFALQAAALAAANEAAAAPVAATAPAPAPQPAEPAVPQPAERAAPQQAEAAPRAQSQATVSYPTVEPVSPLLAGIIGMLLGALFATLLFSARRIIDSLRRNEWSEAEATQQFDAFTETDTLDAYEHVEPVSAPLPDAEDSQHIDLGELSDTAVPRMNTDEFPVSPFGTIEVEFSELDALAGKTLGFDLSEALGNTAEQPKLGESPRINLEGLGSNFDLNRELEEMLEEFEPDGADTVDVDVSELLVDHEDTDVDLDVEEDGEETHPQLDEDTSSDQVFNVSQTMLADGTNLEDAANQTLAIKPLSLGLDLDLGLNGQQDPDAELGFSLDAESLRDKTDSKD